MDYFNGNGLEENISIQDMIDSDIRSNFNEQLENGDVNFGCGGGIGSMLDYDIHSLDMTDSKAGLAGLVSGSDLNWLQAVNLSSLQALCKAENTDPNLMVNPQTGMPISQEQSMTTDTNAMLSQTTHNLTESAVRDALLRTPDHTTYVAVAPSQVQPQPQYIHTPQQQPQIKQEPEPTRQPHQTQSQTQTIRQHLQAQVHQGPQSPVSITYPSISSPQPMVVNSPQKTQPKVSVISDVDKIYPKPVYSYSCLIAMALKNCDTGCLPVSEIYNFMTENFPYFKTAPDGWKNSVRHNLSLNKCFEKIENPKSTGTTKKGCLWAMNPAKIEKMEEEIAKWRKKDPQAIKRSMAKPEVLDLLEQGQGGKSPHRTVVSTPTIQTPTKTTVINNNNITKLTPITVTSAASELRLSKVVTSISANVNVIEIKPVKVEGGGGAGGATRDAADLANLTPDELSVLDNNMTLDSSMTDLEVIQNGLFGAVSGMFDDLNGDDLNMEDIPHSASPLSFTFSSGGLTASPIHFNAGASGASNFIVTPNIDEKAAIQSSFNLFNCSAATPTSSPTATATKYTVSRAVSAQT